MTSGFHIRFFYLIVLSFTWSCSALQVSELTTQVKEARLNTLVDEQKLYTPFSAKRTFHNGLKGVLVSPEKEPYPLLDSLFECMFQLTNEVVFERLVADTLADEWLVATGKLKRLKASSKFANDQKALLSRYFQVRTQIAAQEVAYQSCSDAYDSLKKEHGIFRQTHFQLLEKAGGILYRFQDSLELQGAELAGCKRHLKSTGLKLGTSDFASHYSYLSDAELLSKQYQNRLLQLENVFARFESGNAEEIYFEGPYLLPRMDVTIFNELISQLTIEMERFRMLKKSYYDSFSVDE